MSELSKEAPFRGLRSIAGYRLSIGGAVAFHVGVYPRALVTMPARTLEGEVSLPLQHLVVLSIPPSPLPPHDEERGDSEDGDAPGPTKGWEARIIGS